MRAFRVKDKPNMNKSRSSSLGDLPTAPAPHRHTAVITQAKTLHINQRTPNLMINLSVSNLLINLSNLQFSSLFSLMTATQLMQYYRYSTRSTQRHMTPSNYHATFDVTDVQKKCNLAVASRFSLADPWFNCNQRLMFTAPANIRFTIT